MKIDLFVDDFRKKISSPEWKFDSKDLDSFFEQLTKYNLNQYEIDLIFSKLFNTVNKQVISEIENKRWSFIEIITGIPGIIKGFFLEYKTKLYYWVLGVKLE